mmetsp:Transcript_18666/g.39271  ORF Transcript_18666/g.39271 Transcript_18666/m.39271 type:complete len:634 (+) Transcript_18666:271-2172(+)
MLSAQLFSTQAFISPIHPPSSCNRNHACARYPTSPLFATSSRSRQSVPSSPSTKRRRRSRAKPSNGHNVNHRSSKPPKSQNKPPKQAPRISINEAKTMGEAIQIAQSISDYLTIVEKFVWLPTDDNLPPHLRTQAIHHEKRRRWGSQWIEGLGQAALASWETDPVNNLSSLLEEGAGGNIWTDARLVRAIMSVALPIQNGKEEETSMDRPEKEGVWIAAALKGLHVLSGCIAPTAPSSSASADEVQSWLDLHRSISMLIHSADRMSEKRSLKDATETRWAIRGLTVRLQLANSVLSTNHDARIDECNNDPVLDFTTPNLNARTSNLPFDIFSHCLPWQIDSNSNPYYGYPTQELTPEFLQSIPFNFDTLTTRTGDAVIERRGTAWLAENDIGALAYSGKLMRPAEVPEVVRGAMREVEEWCVEQREMQPLLQKLDTSWSDIPTEPFLLKWDCSGSSLPYHELGQFVHEPGQEHSNIHSTFFDCALCNHYPDGDSACKFHTDPEHGTHWHRTTAVVSCGTSRIFAFRPIPEVSTWSEWDDVFDSKTLTRENQQTENSPATLQLFPGDVVFMTGACNDLFHHAVYSSPFDRVGINNSRVSLVFKRALDRGGGKKGHGLAGQGRRARQRNRRQYNT